MRFFVCLLTPNGLLPDTAQRSYETVPRTRGLAFRWQAVAQLHVLTAWDDAPGELLVAEHNGTVAVGMARLDNRADLERWSGASRRDLTDLELVRRTVAQHGTKHVPQILGDFAFLVWNAATGTAVAAVDPFAVKKLYYAERNGLLAFASRAEPLAHGDHYEVKYLAQVVAETPPSPELTVYAGVRALAAGTIALVERGRISTNRYWSASHFEPDPSLATSEREAAQTCRDLLAQSVRLRLSDHEDTWAQLSGGLDSSTVVSVAQWLAERGDVSHGLAGTVSYVDRMDTGADEREYSDAVVDRWRLRNETIVNPPVWYDERYAVPHLDQPRMGLMVYPRDRRLCEIVGAAGGRVLLTGTGSDELLTGNMFFFADWLVRGHAWRAIREMVHRAAIGRASFWELAYRNALLPLAPRSILDRLPGARDRLLLPPWLHETTARQYDLRVRDLVAAAYTGRIGHKYHDSIVANMAGIAPGIDYEVIKERFDVRHPFLYRPLVEFALRLPPELCARPQARKWVLREAMRGILPETVRTRVGKATTGDLLTWSMTTQHRLLAPLVQSPILADLGIVDAKKLQTAFHAALSGGTPAATLQGTVQHTLTVEAWLQIRSGRWPRGTCISTNEAAEQVHRPSA